MLLLSDSEHYCNRVEFRVNPEVPHLRKGAVPGAPVHDGAAPGGTGRMRWPTGGHYGAPRGPMSTSRPTRSGGRQLGGLRGTAACWPWRRVIRRGPRLWRDYAGQLEWRRVERGGEGAPGAYHKSNHGDGWGGGVPRWPGHVRAVRLAALLREHRCVTPPSASSLDGIT
jgi:hypothetical protein